MRLFGGSGRDARAGRGQGACAAARAHLVCSECRHAQLYPVRPRAVCTCPGADREGEVVYSGQPACDRVEARRRDERTLAWCSLRTAGARSPYGRIRPRLF